MSAVSSCPQCGAVLPPEVPKGLCTRCALKQMLAEDADATPTVAAHNPKYCEATTPGARRRFGDYELLDEIARGGMGVVFKARQSSLDRIVAIKMVLGGSNASKEFIHRFRTEAAAAANLQHPNIVAVHEVGAHEGENFLVMDFVDGPNLARLVGQPPLPASPDSRLVKAVR